MEIFFLSVTVILVSLVVTSYLSRDNEAVGEYNSDDTVHAFALSTIGEINYAFTIDQANNRIYNIDSLPFRADAIYGAKDKSRTKCGEDEINRQGFLIK